MSRSSILLAETQPAQLLSIRAIGRLTGASSALAAVELARGTDRPLLLLASDPRSADQLEAELRFFGGDSLPVLHFVEWETLPWDSFSPHQDIISQRLTVLSELPTLKKGIVVASAPVLLQRLPPTDYVGARSLNLTTGKTVNRQSFIDDLVAAGYLRVPQVSEHGEFAVRGSLLDVFPMGALRPLRIDFFDDEIESLRWFDADSQLSGESVGTVSLLPAREIPLDQQAVLAFRRRYRERFEGQPSKSRVYREVSDGIAHGGIEYYLPLFFDHSSTLLDYLPSNALVVAPADCGQLLTQTWAEIEERYELCRLDPERPVLTPSESFVEPESLQRQLANCHCIDYSSHSLQESVQTLNLPTRIPPAIRIETRYEDAASRLTDFLDSFDGRVLFTTDSPGRREAVYELLSGRGVATMDNCP